MDSRIHLPTLLPMFACMLLAGCAAVGPNFKPEASQAPADWSAWKSGAPELREDLAVGQAELPQKWWTVFKDPVLDRLEDRALDANLDVRTAALRFAQSRVQRDTVAAQRGPQVTGSGSATRRRESETGASTRLITAISPGGAGNQQLISLLSSPYNLYQAGFDASWELDLWGSVRRSIEAADADAAASEQMLRQSQLSIASEVARSYFELRDTQRQMAITRADIQAAEETLNLVRARVAGGMINALDETRQQSQLADLKARWPQLLAQEAGSQNQLAVLLGARPGEVQDLLAGAGGEALGELPDLALGVPGDVARRRPDIRRAEAQLHSATANIGVATADLYPRITLGASFGLESLQASKFGDWGSRRWSVGPSLSLPIFDHGRRKAVVELRKLQEQEAAVAFQQAVLKAWQEVDDGLNGYNAERKRNAQLREKERSAREARDLAQARYAGGLTDYLGSLDAQRTLLQAQRDLAQSDGLLRERLVAVYKSVGGGSLAEGAAPPKG